MVTMAAAKAITYWAVLVKPKVGPKQTSAGSNRERDQLYRNFAILAVFRLLDSTVAGFVEPRWTSGLIAFCAVGVTAQGHFSI